MQERRSNRERSDTTTASLMAAARELFVTRGFAATGTPELVAAAGVTRGALYHHFEDKKALFRAVVTAESRAVAEAVEQAVPGSDDTIGDLVRGGEAYLDAMAQPGRARLLMVEAPAVLGPDEAAAIDAEHAGRTLREGIGAALDSGALHSLDAQALADILNAAYDRAALAIARGADRTSISNVIKALVTGLGSR